MTSIAIYMCCIVLCLFSRAAISIVIVKADYNMSMTYMSLYYGKSSVSEMIEKKTVRFDQHSCLSETSKPKHSVNIATPIHNITETENESNYLKGTTYWFNEYLHVGHVFYDSSLIQALQAVKIDRIIIQRAACHGMLCGGVGSFRSFFGK